MKSLIITIKASFFASCLLFFISFGQAQEFETKISLENAHLGEIVFACQAGASEGYDRGKDIFCPPGGMGDVGLVWFAAPQADLPALYKDVRDCVFPQQWKLEVQPPLRKKLLLKWEPNSLAKGLKFQLVGDEVDLDMKKVGVLTISTKGTLLIKVSRDASVANDEKK